MTEKDTTAKSLCQRWVNIGLAAGVAAVGVWFFFTSVGLTKIRDYDDFWHLWTGRLIFESGTVPRVDPVCFTTAGLDWINLNWLAQLINYRLFLSFGLAGPMALGAVFGAIILLCHLAILRRSFARNEMRLLPALISIGLVIYAIRFTHGSRPQDYSFALLAVLNFVLRTAGDEKKIPPLFFLPISLLLILWNNLHGGVIFGYILIGCDILGSAVASKRDSKSNPFLTQRAAVLAAAAVTGLAGFALHPHGLAALLHTVNYSSSMRPIFYQRVYELMPPSLISLQGGLLSAYGLTAAALLIASKRFSPLREIIFFVIFACFSQSMQRFLTPFLIVTVPFVAESGALFLKQRAFKSCPAFETTGIMICNLISATVCILLLGWLAIFVPSLTPGRTAGLIESPFVDHKMFPVGVVKFLKANRVEGRIFNEYGSGGYLGWALYPERRIFIDGRGDLISQGPMFDQYFQIVELRDGYRELLEQLQIQLVVMPSGSKLVAALRAEQSPGWSVLFDDGQFALLSRKLEAG